MSVPRVAFSWSVSRLLPGLYLENIPVCVSKGFWSVPLFALTSMVKQKLQVSLSEEHSEFHLSNRAEDGTRTRDPNLGKVVLYQLSYFRVCLLFKRVAKIQTILIPPNVFDRKTVFCPCTPLFRNPSRKCLVPLCSKISEIGGADRSLYR